MQQLLTDTLAAAPLSALIVSSLLVILLHTFRKDAEHGVFLLSLAGIAAALVYAVLMFPERGIAFSGMIVTGGYASIITVILLLAAALALLHAREVLPKIGAHYGEFYILVMLSLTGMVTLATAYDLVAAFIGLEIMSVSLYVLAGLLRAQRRANEAALKYFLLGAFSTGFMLYGIALIYGATGGTGYEIIMRSTASHGTPVFLAGLGLLLVGFAFKIGAVPFHMWVPDVYDGSSTLVTAFMATAAKASAFSAIIVFFSMTFDTGDNRIGITIAVLATASMLVGNVAALAQDSVKRMLAYSSIAHAGYMLVGISSLSLDGMTGVLFYLLSYVFTTAGSFGLVALVESANDGDASVKRFAGLGRTSPLLAALMTLFLLSLIGLPPLSGFFGKYYVFFAAVKDGAIWLAIAGVVTSMISLYYYLRVIVVMYFTTDEDSAAVPVGGLGLASLLLSAAGVLLFGLFPRLFIDVVKQLPGS
ncbi:MAG: NADH-quinone oxidoreductase subunit N [Ignavibacteriae bacterium]|nr:NADH-quinone oxidoreductase subunit N [Ignavibacteriota bacterium]